MFTCDFHTWRVNCLFIKKCTYPQFLQNEAFLGTACGIHSTNAIGVVPRGKTNSIGCISKTPEDQPIHFVFSHKQKDPAR
jgi:hypothetical protein